MKIDSRLSGILHILLHMAEHPGPLTSEQLAGAMNTNPVVVRRTLSGLRKRGYVSSEKGPGGGWQLTVDLASITLKDVYDAIGQPALLAIGNRSDNPACLVEKSVNASLDSAFRSAEQILLARLREITLQHVMDDFHARMKTTSHTESQEHNHAL